MDFQELLVDSSRLIADIAEKQICDNPQFFGPLLRFAMQDKDEYSMRAARVVEMAVGKKPKLIKPFLGEVIEKLPRFKVDGVKRSLLKIFTEYLDIVNEDQLGYLVDCCFNFLKDRYEPVAVKYYSIKILYDVSNREPDLKHELILTLETLSETEKKSIIHESKRVLKRLYKETR
ncbi:MAG: hypothetical protein HY958_00165 [Bacteroidia bacterium]|nr:hypothetical protein [Bacteroidia bacterium]